MKYLNFQNNVVINPLMNEEIKRLLSFINNWPHTFLDKYELATCGFYFLGEPDLVKCFFCDIEIALWDRGDDPARDHLKWSKRCPLINNLRTINKPIEKGFLRFLINAARKDLDLPEIQGDIEQIISDLSSTRVVEDAGPSTSAANYSTPNDSEMTNSVNIQIDSSDNESSNNENSVNNQTGSYDNEPRNNENSDDSNASTLTNHPDSSSISIISESEEDPEQRRVTMALETNLDLGVGEAVNLFNNLHSMTGINNLPQTFGQHVGTENIFNTVHNIIELRPKVPKLYRILKKNGKF